MRYEILGPVRVGGAGAVWTIGAPKLDALLAALLIRADQVVGPHRLIHEVWGREAPRHAGSGLHHYIAQLRKFLARAGHPGRPIVARTHGYMLHLGPSDEFDGRDFLEAARAGRTLAREGRHEEVVARLEDALALWRGPVLGGLTGASIMAGYALWLNQTRAECTELLVESMLELGRHREVVGRLYALVAEYPLHEAFHRQLMLALYRSERGPDALRAYESAQQVIKSGLGLEPDLELRALRTAILDEDRRLERFAA